jgi:hypothetical protein
MSCHCGTGTRTCDQERPFIVAVIDDLDEIAAREDAEVGGCPSLSRAADPNEQISFRSVKTAPPSRAATLAPGKNAREVALIDKAAELSDISKCLALLQKISGTRDALSG